MPPPTSIQQVLAGDLEAYRSVVQEYEGDVFRLVVPALNDRQAAEDVVQECFITAYRMLDRFDPQLPFRPWLLGIARNVLRNELRRRVRESARLEAYCRYLDADSSPALEDEALLRALADCRRQLQENAAEALRLRYDQEWSLAEIAAQLQRTVTATQQLLYRTRLTLRDCVEQRLGAA